ncbi:MAG: hypothetical protein IJA20_07530 [Methanocorpusculum sp.]|nr:hypothetical protein [Methanocorpusculum sp.]
MKMKNVLMILITLAVVFAMAGAVSADKGFKDNDKSMTVNYSVEDNYVVEIPADVIFKKDDNNNKFISEGQVNATNVLINPGKKLVVNLTSNQYISCDNIYYLDNSGSWIRYYINKTESESPTTTQVTNDTYVLTVNAGDEHPVLKKIYNGFKKIGGYVTLSFETTQNFIDNATKSGVHEDSLTFTLDVVENNNQNTNQ